MGKFRLKSGNTPTFKEMGSAFLQPSGEDIKEDLKERFNLENIEKPELNIDTEDVKKKLNLENINIEKPNVNVETHVETPRSGEFTGDRSDLIDSDREQRREEILEDHGYQNVNVTRGEADLDHSTPGLSGDLKKKQYSHEQFTTDGSDPVTRTIRTPKEGQQWKGYYGGHHPYTTEFAGGQTELSQRGGGVAWNESTGKYEPVKEGFTTSDYERIGMEGTDYTQSGTGRRVVKGTLRPELGGPDVTEKYVTKGEHDYKAVRTDDKGRHVVKTSYDPETGITTDKYKEGFLGLGNKNTIYRDAEGNEITKEQARDIKRRIRDEEKAAKKLKKQTEKQKSRDAKENPMLIPNPEGGWMKNPNYIAPV